MCASENGLGLSCNRVDERRVNGFVDCHTKSKQDPPARYSITEDDVNILMATERYVDEPIHSLYPLTKLP
jgi:hypothetical protein